MADPVGIAGTAFGIVSLCLQVYGSLSDYFHDFQDRDSYVARVVLYLSRLRGLVGIIESAIPSFQNEHSTPSQTVVLCLQDCEAQLKVLDIEVQKYQPTHSTDFKGKLKETKKRLQFPFGRPDIEKLATHLDRINSLLWVAIQGLDLHVQSQNRDKLRELGFSSQVAANELATIHNKVNEILSKGGSLEANLNGSQAAISKISQDMQELSLVGSPKINQIQADASSSVNLLHELTANYQQSTSKLEERITELQCTIAQASQTSPEERFFQMLMSKPDFLRSCQDDFAALHAGPAKSTREPGLSGLQHGHKRVISNCGCRYRRQTTRQFTRWRFSTRFDERILGLRHEPGCPMFRDSQVEKQHTIGIIFTGLHRILNIAVEASFVQKTGAGGASISPVFRYYAMVDTHRSPAFRTIEVMVGCIRVIYFKYYMSLRDHSDFELIFQQIIRAGISRLQSIFASGHSLPTDVDIYGHTLIGKALSELGSENISLHIIYEAILTLLSMGVPCTKTSSTISICFHLMRKNAEFVAHTLTPLLIQNQPEDYICGTLTSDILITHNQRRLLFEVEGIAEAVLGLDSPLFEALIQKDELLLKRVLPTLPTLPNSFISNGFSALHIAVFWLQGLRIILDFHPDIDLNVKSGYYTPLELAIVTSGEICREKGRLCKKCPCAESTKTLLDSGCKLSYESIDIVAKSGSLKVFQTLLSHIKLWRGRLKELAERELSMYEIQHVGLCDSFVLDHEASKIIKKLESRGIFPSREFQLDPSDYRLQPRHRHGSSSIYHDLSSRYFTLGTLKFDIAFELGFRDIDTFYARMTPIMLRILSSQICEWFIAHGANPTNLVPFDTYLYEEEELAQQPLRNSDQSKPPRHTVSHHLMRRLGRGFFCTEFSHDKIKLVSRFVTVQTGDGCQCGCSDPEGCIPLKLLVGPIFSYYYVRNRPYTLYGIHYALNCVFGILDTLETFDPAPFVASAIIRALTFEALEMRHTCCGTIPNDFDDRESFDEFFESYGDDFPNIRDEDESLLDELDAIVAEFMDEFHSQGRPLMDFLKGHWMDRMGQIIDEKKNKRLTQKERAAAEELGVMLVEGSNTSKAKKVSTRKTKEILISEAMDYFFRKLDDVYKE